MKVGDLVRLRADLRPAGHENHLWLVLRTKGGYKRQGKRLRWREPTAVLNLTTKYLAEGITPEALEVVSESR